MERKKNNNTLQSTIDRAEIRVKVTRHLRPRTPKEPPPGPSGLVLGEGIGIVESFFIKYDKTSMYISSNFVFIDAHCGGGRGFTSPRSAIHSGIIYSIVFIVGWPVVTNIRSGEEEEEEDGFVGALEFSHLTDQVAGGGGIYREINARQSQER